MINFFKRLFLPKEEKVNFLELENWIKERNEYKPKIKEDLKIVLSLKEEILNNLEELKNVNLDKTKAEDKVKNIVKGNINAYIHSINLFLKRINIPQEINFSYLKFFYEAFEREYSELNKKTYRNFQIIKELVGKELENVAKNVKRLELIIKKIKEQSQELKKYEELLLKFKNIKTNIENKDINIKKKKELEEEKNNLLEDCIKIKEGIKNLKESKEFQEFQLLKDKKRILLDRKKNLENEIINFFSPFQKALKKYNNIHPIPLVKDYISDPVTALIKDQEFQIIEILQDIGKMIHEKKIELKEDKKKKIIQFLEHLNTSFLKSFIYRYQEIKKGEQEIKQEIEKNKVMEKIEELKKDFNVNSFKIENIKRELEKIKEIDIPQEIKEFEDELNKVLKHKVIIQNVMG